MLCNYINQNMSSLQHSLVRFPVLNDNLLNCRQRMFENNVALINIHNLEYDLGLHTFTMGINEYSDMVGAVMFGIVNIRFLVSVVNSSPVVLS